MEENGSDIDDSFDFNIEEVRGTENHLRCFIETLETLEVLWNCSKEDYKNKIKRKAAIVKLIPIYSKIKPGATEKDVRRKINTLRCNYRKELKKIQDSKRSGVGSEEVYQPTSWVFYALKFLKKSEQPVSITDPEQVSTFTCIFSIILGLCINTVCFRII